MKTDVITLPSFTEGMNAKLYCYLLDNSPDIEADRVRKTVVLCPGGGYVMTSDREAEPIALALNARGYQVLILRYSVAPARFPTALCELAYTVSLCRKHAKEWHIDPEHIVVMGFSAGAHLACSLGTLWNEPFLAEAVGTDAESFRPNGMMLGYPVITSGEFAHQGSFDALTGEDAALRASLSLETRVGAHTPPAFVWHTWDDDCVPVENALLFAQAMKRENRPLELHIFPHGVHGLSLANTLTASPAQSYLLEPACEQWLGLFLNWMERL